MPSPRASDRIAFAECRPRNRTAHVPFGEKPVPYPGCVSSTTALKVETKTRNSTLPAGNPCTVAVGVDKSPLHSLTAGHYVNECNRLLTPAEMPTYCQRVKSKEAYEASRPEAKMQPSHKISRPATMYRETPSVSTIPNKQHLPPLRD
jgi:hypothetical protein